MNYRYFGLMMILAAAAAVAVGSKRQIDRVTAAHAAVVTTARAQPSLERSPFPAGWGGSDLPSAVIYASQPADGPLKDELFSPITTVKSDQHPDLADKMICEKMSPGPAQLEAAIGIVLQWTLKDPGPAGAWAANFPAGELRLRALNEIIGAADYQAANQPSD